MDAATAAATDWAAYLIKFRRDNGLSQRELSEKTGVGVYALRRIEQGGHVTHPEAAKLREYIESFPIASAVPALPGSGADEVSVVLMRRVAKHCESLDRTEGLVKNLVSRLADNQPEVLDRIRDDLLLQYVLSIKDIEKRHDALLSLLSVGNGN